MATMTVRLDGMHCDACAQRIEQRLSSIEGVRSVEADHEANEATIDFVAGREDEDAVRHALEAMEYSVVDASTE